MRRRDGDDWVVGINVMVLVARHGALDGRMKMHVARVHSRVAQNFSYIWRLDPRFVCLAENPGRWVVPSHITTLEVESEVWWRWCGTEKRCIVSSFSHRGEEEQKKQSHPPPFGRPLRQLRLCRSATLHGGTVGWLSHCIDLPASLEQLNVPNSVLNVWVEQELVSPSGLRGLDLLCLENGVLDSAIFPQLKRLKVTRQTCPLKLEGDVWTRLTDLSLGIGWMVAHGTASLERWTSQPDSWDFSAIKSLRRLHFEGPFNWVQMTGPAAWDLMRPIRWNPTSLTHLHFGSRSDWCSNAGLPLHPRFLPRLPEDGARLLPQLSSQLCPNLVSLKLPRGFNLPLDDLPSTLRKLVLRLGFNQPLDCLPRGLRILRLLSSTFTHPLDHLPPQLHTLEYDAFGRELSWLPESLRVLKHKRAHRLGAATLENLPSELSHLTLTFHEFWGDEHFPLDFHLDFLPAGLKHLRCQVATAYGFFHTMELNNLVDGLTHLVLEVDCQVNLDHLPPTLTHLTCHLRSDAVVSPCYLPAALREFRLSCAMATLDHLPVGLMVLELSLSQPLKSPLHHLPPSIRQLTLKVRLDPSICFREWCNWPAELQELDLQLGRCSPAHQKTKMNFVDCLFSCYPAPSSLHSVSLSLGNNWRLSAGWLVGWPASLVTLDLWTFLQDVSPTTRLPPRLACLGLSENNRRDDGAAQWTVACRRHGCRLEWLQKM